MGPALLLRADQHQFETALPDDLAAQPLEHRCTLTAIGRIGFRAARLAAIGISSLFPQPHQIEHVDRPWPVILPELREYLLGRIDMAHSGTPSCSCVCSPYHALPHPLIARQPLANRPLNSAR